MGRMRKARGFVLLVALAGCGEPVGPAYPATARAMAHRPIQYETWWSMTEACSGLHGDLDAVSWYTVAADTLGGFAFEGSEFEGFWFETGNRIYLARNAVNNGATVRHEMLHALLQSGNHPVEYFVTRCGALAPCGSACGLSEADRGVAPGARQIPSESLAVDIALAPMGAPAASIDSGWVTIMVTATNARPEPVWVTIPDNVSFGYVFARSPGTFHWATESRWAFLAGESRSLAFDLQLPPNWAADSLWGIFGNKGSVPRLVPLGP